jgi:hypothetical protein
MPSTYAPVETNFTAILYFIEKREFSFAFFRNSGTNSDTSFHLQSLSQQASASLADIARDF